MNANRELKTLIFDMEISYAIYYAFPSRKPQYLHSSQLKEYFYVPCFAWRWEHQASTHVASVTDNKKLFKKNHKDDSAVAKKLHELMEEADIVVAHNGDAFDIKHANTLFMKHGLPPIPEKKSVDTLKVARKYFQFAGNDLKHLCEYFKTPLKGAKPDWIKLTEGCPKELKKTARYCKQDVVSLYEVFLKLRPFMKIYPTLRKYRDNITQCDACKSKRLQNRGEGFDGGKMFRRIKCMECGREHRAKNPYKKPNGGR